MSSSSYYVPQGGLPPQTQLLSDRAVFTNAYAVIPKGTLSDITASYLPFWDKTRLWILARPLTGFAETFSHYLMEVGRGGGATQPEPDEMAQSVLFVVSGQLQLNLDGQLHELAVGSYVYLSAGASWSVKNPSDHPCCFHWLRKRYQQLEGLDRPESFIASDEQTPAVEMPDTDGVWTTSRFVDPADLRHDMHVSIVTFRPGGVIPFAETHVMEHGLYVLQGKAVYHLNQNWVEVEAGDYMWLRAFCPQACYAGGPEPFRYLLYKDVNRHAKLEL